MINNKIKNELIKNNIFNILSILENKYKIVIEENGDIYICLHNGLKFYLSLDDPNYLLGLPKGECYFEKECTVLASRLIDKGQTVFDIGANFGWYSCCFSNFVGKCGKVFSFEPTNITEMLYKNIKINNSYEICKINNFALGCKEEYLDIFIPKNLGEAYSSFKEHVDNNLYGESDVKRVKVSKIDNYVRENNINKIDFIKIDVEGAELSVLQGGEAFLQNNSPIIMFELEERHTKYFKYNPQDMIEFLNKLGYSVFEIDRDELLSIIEIDNFNDTKNNNFLAFKDECKKKVLGKGIKIKRRKKQGLSSKELTIEKIINLSNVAIFGTGARAIKLNKYIKSSGVETKYFVDNNTNIQGTYIDGLIVKSPYYLNDNKVEAIIITIENPMHDMEVRMQLESILNYNVKIYSFYELFK